MADPFTGAAAGLLLTEVLVYLKEVIKTIRMFRHRVTIIYERLSTLKHQFDQMQLLNDKLGETGDELKPIHDLLKECQDLVKACVKIRKRDLIWCIRSYSKKLVDLDSRILMFCQIDMVLIINNRLKKVHITIAELKDDINRIPQQGETENEGEQDNGSSKITQFKSCNVPQEPDTLIGMDASFITIKDMLIDGSDPVIVISAAGGSGKTTLVEKLCHDEKVKGKYKKIIFVVVSESPNLMVIVEKILNHLGVKVTETHTDKAVQQLHQVLNEKGEQDPILLVLDDIWSGSKSILEKFVDSKIPNYKVLVTSRYEFPNIGCSHKLNSLADEDAKQLLCQAARPLLGPCTLPHAETIDKVVKCCRGSPLALTVVGKSLRGKDESAWKKILNDWSVGIPLIGTDESQSEILKCLMNSLIDLDGSEELRSIKQYFLDLASFPEDHMIPVAVLIDIWSELHGMDGNGVDVVADIKELCERSLAKLFVKREDLSEGDGYYNDMYVTQHDHLRELAIHQNSQGPVEERERLNLVIRKNNVPKWFKDKKQPLKARLVSICTYEDFASSSWPDLELPDAEVLVLNFRASKNNYFLPDFIKTMKNLKILIVTNNGPLSVELGNFNLITCLPSLKKIRLECIKIRSFNTMDNGLCFKNLEKISAFHCDISDEVQKADLQINQVFPKLDEIDISYCNSLKTLPNGICEAKNLREMSITNCHKLSELPKEIGKLLDLQVLRLSTCTNMKMLPNSIVELEKLSFLDISNCIDIAVLPDDMGKLNQLKELHLSKCSLNLYKLSSSVSKLKQLEYLIVDREQKVELGSAIKKLGEMKLVKEAKQDKSLNFLCFTRI